MASVEPTPDSTVDEMSPDCMVTVPLSDVAPQHEAAKDEIAGSTHNSVISTRSTSSRSSRRSRRSSSTSTSNSVNWEGLEKSEEQQPKDEGTDESTALLLARLEQENNALAHDPKSGIKKRSSRPVSIHHLKKLVDGPQRQSLRYSLLPAPPMTELEFWAALVKDYRQTCQRLPTLTANKIRGGIPPPLRGVVWPAIAGAYDSHLHAEYQRLSNELSPYDGLIGKDVGRSFPNVEMFRERGGEGQQMLARVLKAFSLYDEGIGYCQGLGLIVGPLLMHMGEPEAFGVLVRLMEHYDLRTCYTPDLAGLHLRIYQFQILLSRHCPDLSAHLLKLNIEPLYVSQWFLSFFAVTCPLPMLLRIYDVILSEGATETLMRVALSLMQRNEQKLIGFTEFEDAMQFLFSRALWDTYAQQADVMVADFVSLTNLVTRESLQSLEQDHRQSKVMPPTSILKSAASSLLGRFWAGSHAPSKSGNLAVSIPLFASPQGALRKTPSRQSLTSTLNSSDSLGSEASTSLTEISDPSRSKVDSAPVSVAEMPAVTSTAGDRDLHSQIEELLTALNKLQHQQVELARDLQREREERADERELAQSLLGHLEKQQASLAELMEGEEVASDEDREADELIKKAKAHFSNHATKRASILVSKHQLRDDVASWKEKHAAEAAKCQDLMKRLDERDAEQTALKESLREARARVQDVHRDKQRLEKSVQGMKWRHSVSPDSPSDSYSLDRELGEGKLPAAKGLREFKLGKQSPNRESMTRSQSPTPTMFSKRSSSLTATAVLATENNQPVSVDNLLLELVGAKTAEAVAKQELEETKGKLEALRKIISGPTPTPGTKIASTAESLMSILGAGSSTIMTTATTTASTAATPSKDLPKPDATEVTPKSVSHVPSTSIGGFFSGWGKRAA